MWKRLKSWTLGSNKDRKEQHQSEDLNKTSLEDHKNTPASKGITMVETRSGRRVLSTSKDTSESPVLNKSRSKKKSQATEEPYIEGSKANEPELLEPITLQSGTVLEDDIATQSKQMDDGVSQSLPHRSRNSTQADSQIRSEGKALPNLMNTNKIVGIHSEERQLLDDLIVQPMENALSSEKNNQSVTKGPKTNVDGAVAPRSTQQSNTKQKRGRKSQTPLERPQPTAASNHKRFGSEDPVSQIEILQPHLQESETIDQSENTESESESDAPEEVTAVSAAQEAKASAAKTAQSIKLQKEVNRAKRQKRDLELKAQSQTSRKRKAESTSQTDINEEPLTKIGVTEIAHDYIEDLPDELPAEILALEPELPADSSHTRPVRKRPNKRKRLDQDLKPAKDIRIGNTSIRVLPTPDISLPPKAARQATNIKEAWLRARIKESKGKMAGYRVQGAGARSFLR